MPSADLRHQAHLYQALKERLIASFPDADDQTIGDTLEGITDLHEIIAAIIRSALVDEAFQSGLRTRLDDMRQRLTRLEDRSVRKRQLALQAMSEAGLAKLEQADFTASARSGPTSLIIVDEQSIPAGYWLPQPDKLDRQSLLGDLRRGGDIPGAHLGNPQPVLSVRTK